MLIDVAAGGPPCSSKLQTAWPAAERCGSLKRLAEVLLVNLRDSSVVHEKATEAPDQLFHGDV